MTEDCKYISYIHVDSSNRRKQSTNIYGDLYNLPPYPLFFSNKSSIVDIEFDDHPFRSNDTIMLSNILSKNLMLNNVIMVKKNSKFVRIRHYNHGLSFHGLYDATDSSQFIKISHVDILPHSYEESVDIPDIDYEHYILKKNDKFDISIQLANIKGPDESRNFIGNIPINYLNNTHTVYLLFTKHDQTFYCDHDNYLIMLEKKSTINYTDGVNYIKDNDGNPTNVVSDNNVFIKFNSLYGIPTSIFSNVMQIISVTKNTFTIDVRHIAIVDPHISFYSESDFEGQEFDDRSINKGGGYRVLVRKVNETIDGYPNPNNYVIHLNDNYHNIIQAKIIGSIFPNSQKVINNDPADIVNNKLYWRNLNDGDYIYQLGVTPGNYSPLQLKIELERQFSSTLYRKYMQSDDNDIYDINGFNKRHIVNVIIDDATDLVSFASFRERIVSDIDGNRAIAIPDDTVIFTMMDDLNYFDSSCERLYIYFTPNTHANLAGIFPYMYSNLYQYIKFIDSNTFETHLDLTTAILINFQRTNPMINEINSINTSTILTNFVYEYFVKEVSMSNHDLKIGDIIITDKFIEPNTIGEINIYEVNSIIDTSRFTVKKNHEYRYKFIYDNLLINFDTNNTITTGLVFTMINPVSKHKSIMKVRHNNHQLSVGDSIVISNSIAINNVPDHIINAQHVINKILDDHCYLILLPKYTSVLDSDDNINTIVIRYPDSFQMLFNYQDTLGSILSWPRTGTFNAITPFKHIVSNTDWAIPKKLDMTGYQYFYLCCPELATIKNTSYVSNIFAIIRWLENPGSVVFDSFEPTVKYFNTPLPVLSTLHFSMYHPDGRLVEFNGLDHSFTIEIIGLHHQPTKSIQ